MLSRIRRKNFHTWIPDYVRHVARLRDPWPSKGGVPPTRHVLFAVCDHYEPLWGRGSRPSAGRRRVRAWLDGYPDLADQFSDYDGYHPRHSFFFPGEEYTPGYLDDLATLVRGSYGEVELHLHHDHDTDRELRAKIRRYVELFRAHGHLSTHPGTGRPAFAFIHGNWALANARKDGNYCGVDNELELLFEEGCYADFTFPSAPDECQPNRVNQIYWPTGDLGAKRSYERGYRAEVGKVVNDRLLMITGPLALTRRPRRLSWRIESAALDAGDPPTPDRVHTWIRQGIHVRGRPEWVFVKVHTHGAPEHNAAVLLGAEAASMHETLTQNYNDGERWCLHYVTAREMFNIAVAATKGHKGNPDSYRDFVLPRPLAARP